MEPHELLSAYLDGEVTPTERAEAERLLESSPDLRGAFDDFARLSDLIRGLPRETAPSELALSIRQQAEQQSLLIPDPPNSKRSLRREIISALVAMTVTAAGMLLMVQSVEPQPESTVLSRFKKTDIPAAESGAVTAMNAPSPVASTRAFTGGESEKDFRNLSVMVTTAAETDRELESRVLPQASPSMKSLAESAAPIRSATGVAAPTNTAFNWNAVRIGDFVPYFAGNDSGIAVVEMTVVDIRQTADQMEILLDNYEAPETRKSADSRTAGLAKDSKEEFAQKKKTAGVAASDLVTVYVEGPSSDLAELLHQIDEQRMYLTAQLQPPVDLSTVSAAMEADTAPERNHPSADKLAEADMLTEQFVQQEATQATNRYVQQRVAGSSRARNADAAAKQNAAVQDTKTDGLPRSPLATAPQRRMEALRREAAAAKNQVGEDRPADALLVSPTTSPGALYYRQRNSIVVTNTVNLSEALSANHGNGQEPTYTLPTEAKSFSISAAAAAPIDANGDAVHSLEAVATEGRTDPLARTVRLLLVFQQAPAASPPQE